MYGSKIGAKTNTEHNTVKPEQNGHSNIDKIKILMTNGSLMKVKSIAKWSHF